ncbi:MAG: antirestriction protein [Nitrospira sp.]|nr:antirestriction protein [Nitrospira sp.]
MKQFNNEQQAIVATLVPEKDRLEFLPRHFGMHMLTVENCLYTQFAKLCPTYTGGYWHFYDLSNGGCYLAPSHVKYHLIHADNFFDATVSGEAAGIIVSLFTFSHVSFLLEDDPLGPRIAQSFHLLRDFAGDHPEASLIFRAID